MLAGFECVISLEDSLECGSLKIDRHRCAIDEPLNYVAVESRVSELNLELLRHVLWNIQLDPRLNGLVVASRRQNEVAKSNGVCNFCTCVAEDAANVGSVCVWPVAPTATGADAEPIVADRLGRVENNIISLS